MFLNFLTNFDGNILFVSYNKSYIRPTVLVYNVKSVYKLIYELLIFSGRRSVVKFTILCQLLL